MPRKLASRLSHPASNSTHGGRRPGAGAPKGNVNALKTGHHSRQLHALDAAARALANQAPLLARARQRDRRRLELFALALRYCSDLLLVDPRPGTINEKANNLIPKAVNLARKTRSQSNNQDSPAVLDAPSARLVE